MILHDKFVYIHLPKTGGTFVTNMLGQLHNSNGQGSHLTRFTTKFFGTTGNDIIDTDRYGTKHGTCRQIPVLFRNKPIFTTIRNPYERYVSDYEFGWWKKYPEKYFFDYQKVYSLYPDFPEISFYDFVEVMNNYTFSEQFEFSGINLPFYFGMQTYLFIKYFFKYPHLQILSQMNRDYFEQQKYQQDMFPVTFIKTHNLNQGLYDFLLYLGYESHKIDFILYSEKVFPKEGGRNETQAWQKYYTPKLKQFVKSKEKLLFKLFPEFDL